jgi:GT2 family glycosyltransferase
VNGRPTVSVIVPFAGSAEQLHRCLARLARLALDDGDEVLVADNRPSAGPAAAGSRGRARVVPAAGVRAAGFARNQAAVIARGDWLVFIDADTQPGPDLIDRYLDPLPAIDTGVLAGAIADVAGGAGVAARHAAERVQMSQRVTLDRAGTPYAQSANMAVRRAAFEAVGGFDEYARSGEDADLCFRLARAGWKLEERRHAVVDHPTRATFPALVVQLARHGSGAAWLDRRYPGEFPAPGARAFGARIGRTGARAALAAVAGRRGAAGSALMDLIEACAFEAGRRLSNRARST